MQQNTAEALFTGDKGKATGNSLISPFVYNFCGKTIYTFVVLHARTHAQVHHKDKMCSNLSFEYPLHYKGEMIDAHMN